MYMYMYTNICCRHSFASRPTRQLAGKTSDALSKSRAALGRKGHRDFRDVLFEDVVFDNNICYPQLLI